MQRSLDMLEERLKYIERDITETEDRVKKKEEEVKGLLEALRMMHELKEDVEVALKVLNQSAALKDTGHYL